VVGSGDCEAHRRRAVPPWVFAVVRLGEYEGLSHGWCDSCLRFPLQDARTECDLEPSVWFVWLLWLRSLANLGPTAMSEAIEGAEVMLFTLCQEYKESGQHVCDIIY